MPPSPVRTESAALARRLALSSAQGWLLHLLLLAAFGIALPLRKGLDFFDPAILGAYTCLGAVFASPAAAVRLAEPTLASAHARIAVCVAYGELLALGMTALGIATVYFSHRNGLFFPPALDSLLTSAGFGILLTAALTTLAVWLSLRYSPGSAKLILRLIFLALLLWFFVRGQAVFLGFVWLNSVGVAVFGIVFWLGLRAAIRPKDTLKDSA